MKKRDAVSQEGRSIASDGHDTLGFCLSGQVGAADFLPWMQKHAHKLGVAFTATKTRPDHMCIRAKGAGVMLDAFALACSLGPKSVNVATLTFVAPAKLPCDDGNLGTPKRAAQL